jgi:hypothetical protein
LWFTSFLFLEILDSLGVNHGKERLK